jgi:hypothetical protein
MHAVQEECEGAVLPHVCERNRADPALQAAAHETSKLRLCGGGVESIASQPATTAAHKAFELSLGIYVSYMGSDAIILFA